jgi:histidinol phosphatase-like PHP family hydrolase
MPRRSESPRRPAAKRERRAATPHIRTARKSSTPEPAAGPPPDDSPEGDGTDNRSIAEMLSVASATAEGTLRKALRRAARSALLWPEEARDLVEEGRSLTELRSIGPYLARVVQSYLDSDPEPPRPPPLRRGFVTRAQARRVLAERPLAIQGDLQAHTTWSDGAASVAAMADAAEARGHFYLAITDHSKGLAIAGGIDEAALAEQAREIEDDNRRRSSHFRLLRSMETNLDPLGAFDMEREALDALDLVLGSFHSALRRREDQTERYLAALRNSSIHVLAHPRGRIYDYRAGLWADWDRVFAEAARHDVAVEVDAQPDRQDLDVALLRRAKAAGCRISLGSDAHSERELDFLDLAAAAVRLAGIPDERVINTMSAEALVAWAASVRGRRAR